ncbi:MAG: hypothetical protein AMJ41_03650 [candidate division Zixibacteria bacterium DG_27]|nr:MAG: hypothetical protein AMJ41_03650 [candidate division Zixibacteria bacterium DG_27]
MMLLLSPLGGRPHASPFLFAEGCKASTSGGNQLCLQGLFLQAQRRRIQPDDEDDACEVTLTENTADEKGALKAPFLCLPISVIQGQFPVPRRGFIYPFIGTLLFGP